MSDEGRFNAFTPEIIAEHRRDLPISITAETCKDATFIVTGSNIGIGIETARHLVAFGSKRVIMAVRNLEAGEAAKNDIEATTGKSGVAEVWALDLASYDSVKAFARRATDELDRLDGLIENAAIALDTWSTAEGHETSVTVNVLSTFLLGVLLFPKLTQTASKFGITPHLVVLSSSLAFSTYAELGGLRDGGLSSLDDEAKAQMTAR
jgi:NAD(P)-dependent dehydrogenase (short-subunit alcohol dehydrogenase family)